MARRFLIPLLFLPALAALLGALVVPGGAAEPRFVREEIRIPGADGSYTLWVTILRPRGNGPYGAVILNHGVPPAGEEARNESPELLMRTAAAFVERSYAVFMPLRRGFGVTGGEIAESAGSCSDPDFQHGERAAARDVLAAYEFARKVHYVDRDRMILAGQSAGGVASLYAAAQSPEGLAAVLAFGAGRGGDPARASGVPCAAARLADLFGEVGKAVRVPVLLHYAENDLFFGPETSRLWFGRLKAGGAAAEYVLQPPFGADGHFLFVEEAGIERWVPVVERFLRRHDIPFALPAGART